MRLNDLKRVHVFSDFAPVFGFDRDLLRFSGFLYYLYGFAVSYLLQCHPHHSIFTEVLTGDKFRTAGFLITSVLTDVELHFLYASRFFEPLGL